MQAQKAAEMERARVAKAAGKATKDAEREAVKAEKQALKKQKEVQYSHVDSQVYTCQIYI